MADDQGAELIGMIERHARGTAVGWLNALGRSDAAHARLFAPPLAGPAVLLIGPLGPMIGPAELPDPLSPSATDGAPQ